MLKNIFIAYNGQDNSLKEELLRHLTVFERAGIVKNIWHDGDIEAGSEWETETVSKLESADIILLLVSANAIASDAFYNNELARALERHNAGTCKVVPVILSECAWELTPLGKLRALPEDGIPITSAQWSDRNEAYHEVSTGLIKLLDLDDKTRSIYANISISATIKSAEREFTRKTGVTRPKWLVPAIGGGLVTILGIFGVVKWKNRSAGMSDAVLQCYEDAQAAALKYDFALAVEKCDCVEDALPKSPKAKQCKITMLEQSKLYSAKLLAKADTLLDGGHYREAYDVIAQVTAEVPENTPGVKQEIEDKIPTIKSLNRADSLVSNGKKKQALRELQILADNGVEAAKSKMAQIDEVQRGTTTAIKPTTKPATVIKKDGKIVPAPAPAPTVAPVKVEVKARMLDFDKLQEFRLRDTSNLKN